MASTDLLHLGFVNRVFPEATFRADVDRYLQEQLDTNDYTSMLEAKRLMMDPLRENRALANYRAANKGVELFVTGLPNRRFAWKAEQLAKKKQERGKL
jgi:peroxisomal 3,2-trans-enoyl-CoA isomerase